MAYITNIEEATKENKNFRRVLYTAPHSQLVTMCLAPGEDIGKEVHSKLDQFIRIESGEGRAVINGDEHYLGAGYAVVIPAGTEHNIINTSSSKELKLYTVYSPPQHPDGEIQATREEAIASEEDH